MRYLMSHHHAPVLLWYQYDSKFEMVDDLGLCLHNIPFNILKNELNWYFTCGAGALG